jgi:hypothetical protein
MDEIIEEAKGILAAMVLAYVVVAILTTLL